MYDGQEFLLLRLWNGNGEDRKFSSLFVFHAEFSRGSDSYQYIYASMP